MSWVKKDEMNREECLPELMVKVRLPLLTPQFLSDRVATEDLVKSSHKCRYDNEPDREKICLLDS